MLSFRSTSKRGALVSAVPAIVTLMLLIPSDSRAQTYSLPTNDDLPRGADLTTAAEFAWNQFLALSRKASFYSDGRRGTADASGELGHPGDILVWQTYAHKVELRPNQPLITPWDELGSPDYRAVQGYLERIMPGSPNARWDLWNNLDEDSEIGSCNVISPFQTSNYLQELVLYQVKVNRDEYEYIRRNYGADQHEQGGKLGRVQAQVKQSIKSLPRHAYYPGMPAEAQATCECPPELAICLPCAGYEPTAELYPEGAIEVKSAWRRLNPTEDASQYFTSEAVYYEYDNEAEVHKYYNDTFALIGIHIIRKLADHPDFVFTTFEHKNVEQTDYEYYLIDDNGAQIGYEIRARRQTGQTNRTQNHPVPPPIDRVNHRFQTQEIPDTVWANYRLTGVQASSVNCPVDPLPDPDGNVSDTCRQNQDPAACTHLDPNYFMANLVIESDPFLNNFSGPGFGGNPFGNCKNTVYNGTAYNNGGCKGCHGVAQTAFGTDFSFLLDFGNGKPATEPDTIFSRPFFAGFKGPLVGRIAAADYPDVINCYDVNGTSQCHGLCVSRENCTGFLYTGIESGLCLLSTSPIVKLQQGISVYIDSYVRHDAELVPATGGAFELPEPIGAASNLGSQPNCVVPNQGH